MATTFYTFASAALVLASTPMPIESGLDIILSHFEESHFPRRISTYITEKNSPWQVPVNSRDEALAPSIIFILGRIIPC